MIINTRDFGYVEVDEKDVIHFPLGIIAFETVKEYVLLEQNDDDSPVMYLQSVHDTFPSFIVLNPFELIDEYAPTLPKDIEKELDVHSPDMLRYFVIAVVPKDIQNMTVNLKSPIVLNTENNKAAQVILENSAYPVRHYLFEKDGRS